jgi:hypothetical protein
MNQFGDVRQYEVSSKTGGKEDIYVYLCVDRDGNFVVRKWYDSNNHPASDWVSEPLENYLPDKEERRKFLDKHLPKGS